METRVNAGTSIQNRGKTLPLGHRNLFMFLTFSQTATKEIITPKTLYYISKQVSCFFHQNRTGSLIGRLNSPTNTKMTNYRTVSMVHGHRNILDWL